MIVLDTDILTLFLLNHPRVLERRRQVEEEVVITTISRIEILQGRFATSYPLTALVYASPPAPEPPTEPNIIVPRHKVLTSMPVDPRYR